MYLKTPSLALILALCGVAIGQSIEVYARHLSPAADSFTLGALSYDSDSHTASFTPQQLSIPNGDYCIGTSENDCFSLASLDDGVSLFKNKQFSIQLGAAGEVLHISLINSKLKDVLVKPATSHPVPNLNPAHAQKQAKAPQRKVVTKIVEDENGNQIEEQVEVEEIEEDTRSFVQKYWMYIITALFLVLALFSGEEEAPAK